MTTSAVVSDRARWTVLCEYRRQRRLPSYPFKATGPYVAASRLVREYACWIADDVDAGRDPFETGTLDIWRFAQRVRDALDERTGGRKETSQMTARELAWLRGEFGGGS